MHEQDDTTPNVKVILLAVGGAALAALTLAALRRRDDAGPKERIESAVGDVKAEATKDAKKAAKAAKKKQKELAAAAAEVKERAAREIAQATATLGHDAKARERDLKAAAWDAQQQAQEAEGRLRAAGHRVVDDATHLASRVGAEARNLAGEGKERIAHLRHRDDAEAVAEREIERLRDEIEELKGRIGKAGRRTEREYSGLTAGLAAKLSGKRGSSAEAIASQAAAAALAEVERSLRDKAPALLAARNRAQVVEILQKELGPTLRETAVQAATAALGMWESSRDRADDARDRAHDVADELRGKAHQAAQEARETAGQVEESLREQIGDAADEAAQQAESVRSNGARRFWRGSRDAEETVAESGSSAGAEEAEAEHRGKAGLFWGGAGLGLALYALLDTERREKVLRLANEASVQVQELVRDLQGYDDEF